MGKPFKGMERFSEFLNLLSSIVIEVFNFTISGIGSGNLESMVLKSVAKMTMQESAFESVEEFFVPKKQQDTFVYRPKIVNIFRRLARLVVAPFNKNEQWSTLRLISFITLLFCRSQGQDFL